MYPKVSIMLNGKTVKVFSFETGIRQRRSLLLLLFKLNLEILANVIRQKKQVTGIKLEKRR